MTNEESQQIKSYDDYIRIKNLLKKNDSKIKNCPLWIRILIFSSLKNLYSEILSKIPKLNENYLIRKIKNNKCKNCGLIFKNYWFDDKILEKIEKFIKSHQEAKILSLIYFQKGVKFSIFETFISRPE